MSDELRIGLIGFGLAGQVYHAPLIDAVDGIAVSAIVTGDPDRQSLARTRYPSAEIFDGAAALFDSADRLDAVVVATRNDTHAAFALDAIGKGLPVVVDKPFARTVAEAASVLDAATAAGVMVSAFHSRRWDGDFRTVRRLLEEERLGTVTRFESHLDRWVPEITGGWRDAGKPGEAAGMLYDLGAHLIDQAITLFGPVESVYAEIDTVRPDARADDCFFLALSHRSGVRSHLGASLAAGQPAPRFRVLGTTAAYVKNGTDPQGDQIKAGLAPRGHDWGVVHPKLDGILCAGDRFETVPATPGDYCCFYEQFRDAVRGIGPNPVDAAAGLATLEVIEAAQRSAGSRTPQFLSSPTRV